MNEKEPGWLRHTKYYVKPPTATQRREALFRTELQKAFKEQALIIALSMALNMVVSIALIYSYAKGYL